MVERKIEVFPSCCLSLRTGYLQNLPPRLTSAFIFCTSFHIMIWKRRKRRKCVKTEVKSKSSFTWLLCVEQVNFLLALQQIFFHHFLYVQNLFFWLRYLDSSWKGSMSFKMRFLKSLELHTTKIHCLLTDHKQT